MIIQKWQFLTIKNHRIDQKINAMEKRRVVMKPKLNFFITSNFNFLSIRSLMQNLKKSNNFHIFKVNSKKIKTKTIDNI